MKKVSRSRVFGWLVFGLVAAAVVQSCDASSDEADAPASGGTGNVVPPDSGDAKIDVALPENGGAGGQPPYNPLCGVVDCVPDRANACPPTNAGTGGSAGRSSAGAPGDGGRGSGASGGEGAGSPPGGGPSDGGVGGEGGQGASANAGGQAGEGSSGTSGSGATEPVMNSCQVRPKNGAPRAQCVPAGPGAADAPCLRGSDCAPGLACV
jgi:hypothetical protein